MDRTPQTNSSIPGKELDTIRHFAKLVNRSIRERVRAALLMTLDQPIADGQEDGGNDKSQDPCERP